MPWLSRRSMLLGATAGGLLPKVARAAPRVVRIGHNISAEAPSGQGCRAFAAAVAADALLQAVLRVEVWDNAEMGDELSTIRGTMDGSIDMTLASTSVIGNIVPEAGLLDTLFLFRNAVAARAALDGEIGMEFAELLKAKGINVLAWGENGMRQMTGNRPVRRPADLAGLKLRVPQSDVEVAGFRFLGADARPLSFGALYEALRTGDFDAQENSIATIEAARLFEVQKVLSLTNHIYSAFMMIASQDLLEDLTRAQQAALVACARQGGAAMRQAADAAQRDGVARLRAAGMTIVEDVDAAAFIAASKPNMLAMGQKYGADRVGRLIRAGA